MTDDIYGTDILLWSEHQAGLLRRRAAGELVNEADIDWPNIAEEIEDVGNAQRDKLETRVSAIIEHLIKLQASPARDPRAKWKNTVSRCRRDVARILKRSATFAAMMPEIVQAELIPARKDAGASLSYYGEMPVVDVQSLSYTVDQIIGDWFPPDE